MIPICDYLDSVEWMAAIWLTGTLVLSLVLWRTLRNMATGGWGRLWHGQEGAAYALPYILTFPFLVWLVCLVTEATLVLVVKTGTMYAAFAGARSAIVWESAEPKIAKRQIHRAVTQAMAPFASSSKLHADRLPVLPLGALDSKRFGDPQRYVDAYREFYPDTRAGRDSDYLEGKYRFAAAATSVEYKPEDASYEDDITVKVTYQMPAYTPVLAQLLAIRLPSGMYIYTITSEMTLQNEAPRNDRESLGIQYESR